LRASFFLPVHILVSTLDELGGRGADSPFRYSNRGPDLQFQWLASRSSRECVLAERPLLNSLDLGSCRLQVAVEQQDKFISSPSAGNVRRSNISAQLSCELRQQRISSAMAVNVVHLLELVEVEHDDTKWPLRFYSSLNACVSRRFAPAFPLKYSEARPLH
jgi:hypothetical protein